MFKCRFKFISSFTMSTESRALGNLSLKSLFVGRLRNELIVSFLVVRMNCLISLIKPTV